MPAKCLVAVHLFFLRNGEVLMLRRFQTGWEDGNYSVVAGHVEASETVTQAVIREAEEEVGVCLTPDQVNVVHVMHRKSDDERIDFFLTVDNWRGVITNREPHKCDELEWYPLGTLPATTIPYVRYALGCFQRGVRFSEFGW